MSCPGPSLQVLALLLVEITAACLFLGLHLLIRQTVYTDIVIIRPHDL